MKKNTRASLTWLRIMRFTHQSNLLSNHFLKPYQITASQFDTLIQIATYAPLTQQQLAKKITVSEGGISKLLKRLEDQQWITRKKDWKTNWLSLTEIGEQKIEEVFQAQLQFQSTFFENVLTEAEQKTLYQLMTKVQKNSEQQYKKTFH